MEKRIINKYKKLYGKARECSIKDIKPNKGCIYIVQFNGTPEEYKFLKGLKDQPVLLKVPKSFDFNSMVKELGSDFYDIHSRHTSGNDHYFIHTIVKLLYKSFFST